MATAAMLSCEATRQAFAKTRARQPLHAQRDRGWDGLAAHLSADTPSLEELTQAVLARRQAWTGKITAALVEQRPGPLLHQRTRPCPQCQRLLPARPAPPRAVHTRVGEVSLARPYFDGHHGQTGSDPLDAALQRSERRQPWDLQQATARVAAEVPFKTAQARFAALTGLSWSDPTLHEVAGELSQELGGLEVSPTATKMAHRGTAMAMGKTWRPVMVWASDGAFVPTRPEPAKGQAAGRRRPRAKRAQWPGAGQEAKGGRCDLGAHARIGQVVSGYQGSSDEDVGMALKRGQAAGVSPAAPVRLGVIGDGAKGIWNQVQALLPTAVQILDDDHGREPVHTVGALQCPEAAVQACEGVEALMARRCWGDVDWAIEGWQALQPRDTQAAEAISKLIGVLRNREGRRHDRTARKGGDPMGSGGIESAHTCSSHVRLKRSGAWWSVEQANHRLAWRGAIYNGTFARVFAAYKRRTLQQHGGTPP